jgi:hypothetical protein
VRVRSGAVKQHNRGTCRIAATDRREVHAAQVRQGETFGLQAARS